MICDIKEVETFIKHNNIGLLTSHNTKRVLSSHVPFTVTCEEKPNTHHLALYGILKRKNRQWISLQFNDLILVIFGSGTFPNKKSNNPFCSIQIYGKIRLVDENKLYELSKMVFEQYEIDDIAPNFFSEGFIKEYVGFEFTAHEIYGTLSPVCSLPSRECSLHALFDFTIQQII